MTKLRNESKAPFQITKLFVKICHAIFIYLPYLIKEMLISAIHVAKLVLNPKDMNPGLMKIEDMPSGKIGKVIYANSITLTPGTYTITLDSGEMLVHYIDRSSEENKEMKQKIEEMLC